MLAHLTISANDTGLFAVSPAYMYTFFFIIVMVLFIVALLRQTIILSLLSSIAWLGFALSVFIVANPEDPLTLVMGMLGILLFFIMLVLTVYYAADYLRYEAENRKRRVAEDII